MFQSIVGNIVVMETDIPSRGSGLESLQSKIWWNGLSWLTGTRDTEVVGDINEEEIEKCSLERKIVK